MVNFGQHPQFENRKRSGEEFPSDRSNPGSPQNLPQMQHQGLSQSFSSDSSSEYEDGSKKRKRFMDEASELEDLEQFAKDFKQRRIKMGFTQGDVGVAMGKLYGNDFSQTTISRFEALNLSVKNMCKLKPLLQQWLQDVDNRFSRDGNDGGRLSLPPPALPMPTPPLMSNRRRKKRTSIPPEGRVRLETAFSQNPKPTSEEIFKLSEDLKLDREVVRVWFCNRRQKQKRITIQQQQYEDHSPPASPDYGAHSSNSVDRPTTPPSDDDESFSASHRMALNTQYVNNTRLEEFSKLTAAAGSAVKATTVPQAVPACDASFLMAPRLGMPSLAPSMVHLSSNVSGAQGIPQSNFPNYSMFNPAMRAMKTESPT